MSHNPWNPSSLHEIPFSFIPLAFSCVLLQICAEVFFYHFKYAVTFLLYKSCFIMKEIMLFSKNHNLVLKPTDVNISWAIYNFIHCFYNGVAHSSRHSKKAVVCESVRKD
jgi:hypothetical protein